MSHSLGPLTDGSRVAIIGGGPGGTGCALALERRARLMNLKLKITIVEGKQFSQERHYNQCAGVLSPPLPSLMEEELGIPFPYDLGREEIRRYVLHTDREQIAISENGQHSIALRRIHFDAFMMKKARERGVEMMPARAVDVEFHDDGVKSIPKMHRWPVMWWWGRLAWTRAPLPCFRTSLVIARPSIWPRS